MGFRTFAYGRIFYPAYHFLKRDGFNRARRIVFANETLQHAALAEIQQKKLHDLLEFASKNVPYYRGLVAETGISLKTLSEPGGLQHWRPLTKDLIRTNRASLVSTELAGNRLIPNSTSGSTGEAMKFFIDTRSDAFRKAVVIRNASWAGIVHGSRIVRLWGAQMDLSRSDTLRGKVRALLTGESSLSSFDLSAQKLESYVNSIRAFRPALLVSYPGPLEIFAAYCLERDVVFDSLRAIITSAETLWPHQRALIESAFGVKVFNRYGSREFGDMAQECASGSGLHVNSDRVFLEVLDEHGRPCAPDETGEIFVTDLDNYGMPMIRYRIGDFGTWSAEATCPCGRPFPLLRSVDGRSMDIVETRTGQRIGGTFWTLLLRSREGLKQFQVIQENISGIRIEYVPDDPPPDQATLDYFSERIAEKCGQDFDIAFVQVSKIQLGASGKHRIVMSKLQRRPDNSIGLRVGPIVEEVK